MSQSVYVLVVGAMELSEVRGVYATAEAATDAYTVDGETWLREADGNWYLPGDIMTEAQVTRYEVQL